MPTRNTTRRSIAPPFSSALAEQVVSTRSMLLQAIGRVQALAVAGNLFSGFGATIIIGAPIKLTAPLVITCAGLTIRGAGRAPLLADGIISELFDIRAPAVTLRDLFAYGTDADHFAVLARTTSNADFFRLHDCEFYGGQVYVDSSAGGADDAAIVGNNHQNVGGAHAASVLVDSFDAYVAGNSLLNGGGDVITVAANGSRARIVGNRASGPIHSNASAGENVIMGNATSGGVITAAGSDAVGLNT